MMDLLGEKLDNLNKTLEKQNEIIQNILESMPKPGNRLIRILEFAVLFTGALGVLNAIDTIKNWIIGG